MKKLISVFLVIVLIISAVVAAFILQIEWKSKHYGLPEGYTGGFNYYYNYGAPEMEYYWVESYDECMAAIEKLESHGSKIDKSLIFSYEGDAFDTKYCFSFDRGKTDKIVFGEDPFDRYTEKVSIRAWAFFDDVEIEELIYSNVENYNCCYLGGEVRDYLNVFRNNPDLTNEDLVTLTYVLRSDSSEDFISCVAKYEGVHLYGVDFMPAVEEGVAKEAFKVISDSVVVVGNK